MQFPTGNHLHDEYSSRSRCGTRSCSMSRFSYPDISATVIVFRPKRFAALDSSLHTKRFTLNALQGPRDTEKWFNRLRSWYCENHLGMGPHRKRSYVIYWPSNPNVCINDLCSPDAAPSRDNPRGDSFAVVLPKTRARPLGRGCGLNVGCTKHGRLSREGRGGPLPPLLRFRVQGLTPGLA